MEDIDPTAIRTLVENLMGGPCHFIHDTNTAPFLGGEYARYALKDEKNSRRLCLRIPQNRTGCHAALRVEDEAKVRRYIDAVGINLFQPLVTYDPTTENLIKAPYLALGWADGSLLRWSDISPVADDRKSVMRAVANASLDLLRIQQPGIAAS